MIADFNGPFHRAATFFGKHNEVIPNRVPAETPAPMGTHDLTPMMNFRRPEYTGENRCMPCTILNIIIAGMLALVAGIISVYAGVVVLAGSLFAIYFRGYLVPGTPTLTKRYLPRTVLAWFDKVPDEAVADGQSSNDESFDIETELLDAGIVEPCDDDLCLTEEFDRVWWRRIEQVRDRETALKRTAMVLDLDPESLAIDDSSGTFHVTYEGSRIGTWSSNAAFLADIAVEPTLAEWIPGWDDLDGRTRTQLLAGMRVFLDRCPSCDGLLEPVEDTIKTCCSDGITKVTVDCQECGERVFDGTYR